MDTSPPPDPGTAPRGVLRRDPLMRGAAVLAGLGAVGAAVMSLASANQHLAGALAGGAIAMVAAGAGVPLLWGATSAVRRAVASWLLIIGAVAGGVAAEGTAVLVLAGIGVAGALLVFVSEQGLRLELTAERGTLRRGLPVPSETRLAWSDVQTLRADLREIHSHGTFGSRVEQQQRLVLHDGTTRLCIDSTRWSGATEWIPAVIERAGPGALRWMQAELASLHELRLGPITVTPTELAWRRGAASRSATPFASDFAHVILTLVTAGLWVVAVGLATLLNAARGPERVALDAVIGAEFEGGKLKLSRRGAAHYFRVAAIPNGLLIPDLIRALRRGNAS